MAIKVTRPGKKQTLREFQYKGKCGKCKGEFVCGAVDVKHSHDVRDNFSESWVDCPTKGCNRQCEVEEIVYRADDGD